MNIVDSWMCEDNILTDQLLDICNNFGDKTFLLDLTKSSYTALEKYVYEITIFHLKRLNFIDELQHWHIEFGFNSYNPKSQNIKSTVTYNNEQLPLHPYLTSLSYTRNNNPHILTNIDSEKYNYKQFGTDTEITLSLPEKNKHITFESKYYYGDVNSFESSVDGDNIDKYLIIHLWKNIKPNDLSYYNPPTEYADDFDSDTRIITIHKSCVCNIPVSEKIINYELVNNILYHNKNDSCDVFKKFIDTDNKYNNAKSTTFKFNHDIVVQKKEKKQELTDKHGDIVDDFINIVDSDYGIKYNRFLQRFVYTNVYSSDICSYIIKSCELHATENNGWETKKHHNYPISYISIEKKQPFTGIIFETLTQTILTKIMKSYKLPDDSNINVTDLHVIKLSDNTPTGLSIKYDSFMIFNITLNDLTEFEGGEICFNDGLTSSLEKGELLLYNSKIQNEVRQITKGIKYMLIGQVNIHF